MRNITIAIAAGALLSGCALLDNAFDASADHTAKAMADAYASYCALPLTKRQQLWPLIQANLDTRDLGHTAPVFDCDRDGQPDFDPAALEGGQ